MELLLHSVHMHVRLARCTFSNNYRWRTSARRMPKSETTILTNVFNLSARLAWLTIYSSLPQFSSSVQVLTTTTIGDVVWQWERHSIMMSQQHCRRTRIFVSVNWSLKFNWLRTVYWWSSSSSSSGRWRCRVEREDAENLHAMWSVLVRFISAVCPHFKKTCCKLNVSRNFKRRT